MWFDAQDTQQDDDAYPFIPFGMGNPLAALVATIIVVVGLPLAFWVAA